MLFDYFIFLITTRVVKKIINLSIRAKIYNSNSRSYGNHMVSAYRINC